MSAQKHHHTFAVILLIGVVLLFVLLIYSSYFGNFTYKENEKLNENSTSKTTKGVGDNMNYSVNSELMDFSVEFPKDLEVDESYTHVLFKNDSGEIVVSKRSTNFENLNEYYENLLMLNKQVDKNRESVDINGLGGIRSEIVTPGYTDKAYYFYPDEWTVYSISTTSPELYDELDQVAQSFRYTGDTSSE